MARSAVTSEPLWRVSVTTTPEAEDAVAEMLGALLELPASSCFNVEAGDSAITVFCEGQPARGIRKTVAARLAQIKSCGLRIGSGKVTIAKVRREDWAESWKRYFKPIEIKPRRDELHESLSRKRLATHVTRPSGKSLLIKPSWSRRKPRTNQVVVVLDPGLSFGTGQHPTTAFCLREIVRCAGGSPASYKLMNPRASRPRPAFLDIGTGSGILAIAAAKLGCRPVHAFDFDANAVEIARVNSRGNGVGGKVRFWCRDAAKMPMRPRLRYDLICANLTADLLIAQRRRIATQLERGGTLVLAGILKSEFRVVRAAFETLKLQLVFSRTEREWQSGSFRAE